MSGEREAFGGSSETPLGGPSYNYDDDDDDMNVPFEVEIATKHAILVQLYKEIMSIKGNIAILRTDFDDHVSKSQEKHVEYNKELHGAAKHIIAMQQTLNHIVTVVNNISAPSGSGAPSGSSGPSSSGPSGSSGPSSSGPSGSSGPPGPNLPGISAPKLKMATPDKFGGKRSESMTFQVACNMYIKGTAPNAPDDQKIKAIISYMEGDAREWIQSYLEYNLAYPVPWLRNVTQFWAEFQARFGEVNKEEKNRLKLGKLRQTGSVQDYLRDFQKYTIGLQYGDQALRDMFYEHLKDEIKNMMIMQNFDPYAVTSTLNIVARQALQIDLRLEQLKPLKSSTAVVKSSSVPNTPRPSPTPANPLKIGDKIYSIGADGRAKKGTIVGEVTTSTGGKRATVEWTGSKERQNVAYPTIRKDNRPTAQTTLASVPSIPTAKPDPKGPGPMELDGKGRPQVTCNICGGKGHFARVCPSRGMSGHEAKIEEIVEPESSDEEESGKGGPKTH